MNLSNSQLLFVSLTSSFITSFLFAKFLLSRERKKYLKSAREYLGTPCRLNDAQKKLFNFFGENKPVDTFYLNSCVLDKRSEESKEFSYFKCGVGLVSNPEFKYNPVYVELLFKFDEVIEPGSLYILKYDETIKSNYLEKIKTS